MQLSYLRPDLLHALALRNNWHITREKALLAHAVSEAIKVTPNVIVVLGANYDAVKKEIEKFAVQIVIQ